MTLGSKTLAFSFMNKLLQNTHRLAENKLTDLSLWAKTNSHKMPVYKGEGCQKLCLDKMTSKAVIRNRYHTNKHINTVRYLPLVKIPVELQK